MDYRRAFRSAAVSFADLIARLPADRWDTPARGDRTLRDLVGHATSSGLRQVPTVLATPADEIARASSEDYWLLATNATPETAPPLGDDPATLIGDLVGQATQALGQVEDDALVTTPAGGMRVRDWLPTRTFELVVHALDISAAANTDFHLTPDVYADTATQAARTAALAGHGPTLLRALTGRAPLPQNFSIL